MDRNQAKDFFPIMQAFAEGKVIECRTKPSAVEGSDVPNDWTEMKELEYWNNIEYRIKQQSEAKFRPFNTEEECWQEIRKHEPFIKYKVIEYSLFHYNKNVEQQKLIKRCINEMSSVLLDNLYGYWRGDLSDYLKDRGNLKYFMRGYENDAYNSVMEWLDKKK